MKIYKDEDSEIIYEYIKEYDAEIEKKLKFRNAFARKMKEKISIEEQLQTAKERIKELEEELREYKEQERRFEDDGR